MKITYKSKKPDKVKFEDLFVGQTFYDEDGDLCLKTEKTDCGEGFNGLCLSSNKIYWFSDSWLVTPIYVELIVDGEGA